MGFTINDTIDPNNTGVEISGIYVTCFGNVRINRKKVLNEEGVEETVYVAETTMFYYSSKSSKTSEKKFLKKENCIASMEAPTDDPYLTIYTACEANYADTVSDL